MLLVLLLLTAVVPISTPEDAALNGLTAVQAVKLPTPFICTPTAEDGIVAVPPVVEVRAVALLKYAHTATWLRPGFNTHAVVTVDVAPPGLEVVLGAKVKLMVVPALTVTVKDSCSVAFNCTFATLELAVAATAMLLSRATVIATAASPANR